MPKQLSPDQDKLHKNILRDRFLSASSSLVDSGLSWKR